MKSTILDYFISLVEIDSESKQEKEIALKLEKDLRELGAKVSFDNAGEKVGSSIGNLYAYFPGKIEKEPILFSAHLDTVVPGKSIKPQIENGIVRTDGTTVLGSDDKSGIAEIIWAIKEIKENQEKHAPVEVIFTICEEIGLLGAKHIDRERIKSKIGFALDSHRIGEISIGAPSQNSLKYEIFGKEAHAGAEPQNGINAIKIAADAVSKMQIGRIDEISTCNIGIIKGGKATNIVPNYVLLKGEARSHDAARLQEITDNMNRAVQEAVKGWKVGETEARTEIEVISEYKAFRLAENEEVIQLGKKATGNIGLQPITAIGGGGSDANIFNAMDLKIAVVGSGMNNVHTVEENIRISDLEKGADWVKEVIRIYSK